MFRSAKKTPSLILLWGALAVLLAAPLGCHRHKHAQPDLAASQEPDKVLYERALEDVKTHRYDVARLTLQTLINTYPDSDYLAAAKLAVADSYYEEGTTTALTHAEAEYKDFITFFPNAPEVPLAQYRAAMCHYRQLEKPDRDRTHGKRAEEEFQQLLINYPDSQYAAEGEKRLIQVQEVLGESEFRVARFYFIRESWRAAASRLTDLIERYPNYSKRDQALWLLGQVFDRKIPPYWAGDPQRAAATYTRLVREHPLSEYADDAKAELARLGQPAPEPDPVLLARAQTVKPVVTDEERKRGLLHSGLLGRLFGIISSRPDTSAAAARLGPPPLEPPQKPRPLPPPNLAAAAQGQSTVTAQTVEDVPAGTVVQAPAGQPAAAGQPDQTNAQDPKAQGDPSKQTGSEPPKRKKSFWRKLVPFW